MKPTPRMTQVRYAFELDLEEMDAVLKAEEHYCTSLHRKLKKLPGVIEAEYAAHTGSEVFVLFETEDDGTAECLSDAVETIRSHVEDCDRFVVYVGDTPAECSGKTLLHAGDGFVLCTQPGPGGKRDVSIHFLYDGQRATKYLVDAAAEQVAQLVYVRDLEAVRRIIGRHVDLDPEVTPTWGRPR